MRNKHLILFLLLLVPATALADNKSEIIGPANLSPTDKFYSNTAGELHQLTVTVAPKYKFVQGPSLDVNPGNLWADTGNGVFQLMSMEDNKEVTATVIGAIVGTGPASVGNSGVNSVIPFNITTISRYFMTTFSKPAADEEYVCESAPNDPSEIDVEVTLQNAIGAPATGTVIFTAPIGTFAPPTAISLTNGKATAKMKVTGAAGDKGKIKAAAADVDITNNEKATGEKESQELTVVKGKFPITINTFIPENNVDNPADGNVVFEGDDRSFNKNGSFRTKQTFTVVTLEKVDADGLKDGSYLPSAGQSASYEKSSSLDVTGNLTAAAKADTVKGPPLKLDFATAGIGGMTVVPTRLTNRSVKVICTVEANNPLFNLGVLNSISYELEITIDSTDPLNPTYSITGDFDGFPDYEAYINNQPILQYDHGSDTPFSLGPPMEKHESDSSVPSAGNINP